jgi:hypothetical protein
MRPRDRRFSWGRLRVEMITADARKVQTSA